MIDRSMAAPKPENFEEMAAAWDDPGAFEMEKTKYRMQLARGGYTKSVDDERSYRDD